MRICFVCSEYPPGPHGGIGTMVQLLARALARRGHDVRVVGVCPSDYPGADLESDRGVQITRLRDPGGTAGWMVARAKLLRLVKGWADRGEIDLVELPDWGGWAAGWPRLAVPLIARLNGSATYFGAETGQPTRRLTRWLESASLRRADFVCSVSRYTAARTAEVLRLPAMPDPVLYNPIELPVVEPAPRVEGRVVFTGTLVEKKGIISLVRAWPEVARRVRGAELHVYGKDGRTADGSSMRAHLEALVPSEARPTVTFHGHVSRDQILATLATASVAVFPSYAEAFALAPLEAMACGCPTVYSRRGSGPELMEDGRQGLLVDPDRPDEIAGAIVRVLENRSWAEAMGDAGRRHVAEHFAIDALVEQNERYYRSCLDAFHRRSRHA